MNEYIQAFNNGVASLPVDCDLTGLYGRITRGITDDDFSHLSLDPTKRLSWMFDHEKLHYFLGKSHLDMLINSGQTIEWIHEVKLATWDNVFELLSKVYPEIDSNKWYRYSNELKQMTRAEIDPEGIIVKNYYLGPSSDGYMNIYRFLSLQGAPTLLQVRAFLHHRVGLNELFRGDGRTLTHHGALADKEYLTINRSLKELNQYALIDLNPILP